MPRSENSNFYYAAFLQMIDRPEAGKLVLGVADQMVIADSSEAMFLAAEAADERDELMAAIDAAAGRGERVAVSRRLENITLILLGNAAQQATTNGEAASRIKANYLRRKRDRSLG